MISVVPLGSVLGRVLFVLFVNAFPDNITDDSKIYIYVGDKGFWCIKEQDDCQKLQQDVQDLHYWIKKWLLSFHPDKCKDLRIGRPSIEDQGYKMEKQLKEDNSEKDVGVINDKLSCVDHLAEKENMSN